MQSTSPSQAEQVIVDYLITDLGYTRQARECQSPEALKEYVVEELIDLVAMSLLAKALLESYLAQVNWQELYDRRETFGVLSILERALGPQK